MRQLKISKQFTNRENKSLDKYLNEISKVEMMFFFCFFYFTACFCPGMPELDFGLEGFGAGAGNPNH